MDPHLDEQFEEELSQLRQGFFGISMATFMTLVPFLILL